MKEIILKAFDGKDITVTVWDEVENPVGTVVLSHGMAEYIARYDRFARYLNAHGYIVLGDDHRGHKNNNSGPKGVVDGDSFSQTVEDIHAVVEYAKATYGFEVCLIGHSYGSFLSQRYLEKYSDTIQKCILSGTAYMKHALSRFGHAFASMQSAFGAGKKTAYFIDKMAFGGYDKNFTAEKIKNAWLSRDKAEVEKYNADEYCGYPLCVDFYKYMLQGPLRMYGAESNNIRKDIPVLIAVGGEDPVSNRAVLAQKLYDFYTEKGLKDVHLKIYAGGRHEVLNETNRDEVMADFVEFLNR